MNIDWELAHAFTVDDGVGVRCACELPPIKTTTNDSYRVVVGTQGGALYQWALPSKSLTPIGYQHDNGVSAILSNDQVYVTGCKDAGIRVFDALSHDLLRTLKGHDKAVTSLAWLTSTSYLASGSWDGTAKIWNLATGALVATLPNHENSVCVAGLPSDDNDHVLWVATGSAGIAQNNAIQNHSVRIWKITIQTGLVELIRTVANDHQGPIRDIKLIPETGLLATCSNDGTVKLRSIDTAECIETLAFPPVADAPMLLSVASSSTGIVAAAEDGHIIFWKSDEPQLIRHASSVWQVVALSNQDILTCCQDGVVRVFTQATERVAPDDVREHFRESVLAATQKSGPTQDEVAKLPKWELNALQQGKKEGQVQLFQKNGVAIAAQWSAVSRTWIEVGQVVAGPDGNDDSGIIDGVKYDHVLPIEVDQQGGGVAKLSIGYNNGENPFVAAQRFIDSHMMPQHYLAEIADYIQQRVGKPVPTIGSSTPSTVVPPAIYQHLPMRGFKAFDLGRNANFDKMLTKIAETGQLSDQELMVLKELTDTLSQTNRYHATKVEAAAFNVIVKMLLKWDPAKAFPALDLARLAVLHPSTNQSWNLPKLLSAAYDLCGKDTDGVAVPMLTLRLIANCFKGPVEALDLEQVMELTEKYVRSSNKNVRLSVATVLLNVSSYLNASPSATNVSVQVVSQVNSVLDAKTYETEAMVRALVALGTVLLARTTDAKAVANSLYMATKVEMAASPHGEKAQGVAKEIYILLQ